MIDIDRLIREYGGKMKNGVWEISYTNIEMNTEGKPCVKCKGVIRFDPKDPDCIWRHGTGKYLKGAGILYGMRNQTHEDDYGIGIPGGATYSDMERFLMRSGVRKKAGAIYEQLTLF